MAAPEPVPAMAAPDVAAEVPANVAATDGSAVRSEDVTPERVVSTGLARQDRPEEPLSPDSGLEVGSRYTFWLEVGAPVAGSIETTPTGVSEDLARQEARLTVLLFDVGGSSSVVPGMNRGELRLRPDGSAVVEAQPPDTFGRTIDRELLARRLFFPLRRPAEPGIVRFRCNLYHAGVLIQSRLVRCEVLEPGATVRGALRSTLDYVLARTLTPSTLSAAAPHELSVMTNENERGTHGFYFASGDGTWARGTEFDGQELQALVGQARGALRKAAWGKETEWTTEAYRYGGVLDRQQLTQDLGRICNRGYAFYSALVDRLAGLDGGADDRAEALRTLMRRPGSVQVALHAKPRFVLPASLIYDHDLDTGIDPDKYRLCEQFLVDLERGVDLREATCFMGDCPNRTEHYDVICPSGLWGYRHAIGLPVSLDGGEEWSGGAGAASGEVGDGGDPPGEIDVGDVLRFAIGISTDPDLKLWPDHETALRAIRAGIGWHLADERDETFELLRSLAPHIVYFYCHGGIENGRPFIQVGPKNGEVIFSDNLRARKVRWKAPRPLVFINGCHTTAVEPEVAHELVSGFVTVARASGVIGTEITIFEPLARQFAEAFFRAFFGGASVGQAIRTARLELLQHGNPLGLVYTAYALSNLKMVGLPN